MRNKFCSTIAAVLLSLYPVGSVLSQEHGGHDAGDSKKPTVQKPADSEKKLPLCPVMGGEVDFSVKAMTDDGPVYFCCPGCIDKYRKDPAKYAEKLAAQRDALKKMERIQVTCPITGNPIDGKTEIVTRGKTVRFCCKECVTKFDSEKHTEADIKRLDAKLEGCYTYQTHCPVGGKKIDPTAFVDLPTGQRIYLCCSGCADKLLKDPAKYAPKLAEQGVPIDPAKINAAEAAPKKDEHGGHVRP